MNAQTRRRLTPYFTKSLNLLVIVAMLVAMLPAPASYAALQRGSEAVTRAVDNPLSSSIIRPGDQDVTYASPIYSSHLSLTNEDKDGFVTYVTRARTHLDQSPATPVTQLIRINQVTASAIGLPPHTTANLTSTVYLPVIMDNSLTSAGDMITVTPAQGGVLASSDGYIRLEVPVGAVTSPITITYRQSASSGVPGYLAANRFFELTAQDEQGKSVSQFERDLELTVSFVDTPYLAKDKLALYYMAGTIWQPITSPVMSMMSLAA